MLLVIVYTQVDSICRSKGLKVIPTLIICLIILPEGTSRLISFDHPVKDLSLLGMKLGDRRTEMMVD